MFIYSMPATHSPLTYKRRILQAGAAFGHLSASVRARSQYARSRGVVDRGHRIANASVSTGDELKIEFGRGHWTHASGVVHRHRKQGPMIAVTKAR